VSRASGQGSAASGAWPDAVREARLACEELSHGFLGAGAAAASCQLGEIHRVRGEFDDAEDAYRRASRLGLEPQPGLALLRLAQGQVDTAAAAIQRAVAQTADPLGRSKLLPACVEIMLAAGDTAAAREAASELSNIAGEYETPALRAVAAHARGAVDLADGDASAALAALPEAWQLWRDLDAPYEAARVRLLVGLARRAMGDEDTAAMELDAARSVFEQLEARPDLARAEALTCRQTPPRGLSGLSPREVEVLRLVAVGKTNQAIAADLFLSEKTVARHMHNILTKLGVPSRAAATAYAYEHGLI